MVVLPRLNGGNIENKWQPMSQLMCIGPISRWSSFIAVKMGRSGQPVQNPAGRIGKRPASACTCFRGLAPRHARDARVRPCRRGNGGASSTPGA